MRGLPDSSAEWLNTQARIRRSEAEAKRQEAMRYFEEVFVVFANGREGPKWYEVAPSVARAFFARSLARVADQHNPRPVKVER